MVRKFLHQHEIKKETKNEFFVDNQHLIRPVNKIMTNVNTGDNDNNEDI